MTNSQKPNEEPKRFGLENQVKRNPHPDFNKVENSRPPFDFENTWTYTQIPNKDWKVGSGANDPSWKDHKKLEIDPTERAETLLIIIKH